MHKLPTGKELRERAEALGVVISVDDPTESRGTNHLFRAVASDAEIQRRVVDAEVRNVALRGWTIAFVSAIASVVSAIAAVAAAYFAMRGQS